MNKTSLRAEERAGGLYTQEINIRDHKILVDEPLSYGSADLGPTPIELVRAGLASCTTITLRMYADRKKWPMEHVAVQVEYEKTGQGKTAQHEFTRQIEIKGELDEAQKQRLLEIADKCPVHRLLNAQATIRSSLI